MSTINYADALRLALKTPILEFKGMGYEQYSQPAQRANAFLFLAVDEHEYGPREPYHTRIIQHVHSLITGGHEPCIDIVQIWSYPAVACAITICKHTPTIWAEFTTDQINRLDLIMTAFALMNNLASNDANDYMTGLARRGDFGKRRPPNFRLPVLVPVIAAAHYFGGSDELDKILTGFDYDTFIAKAQTFGYKNLLEVWQTPSFEHNGITVPGARDLLMDGGTTYIISKSPMDEGNVYRGGSGKGARIPYLYHNFRAGSVELINDILKHDYSGGPVTSVAGDNNDGTYLCYILDGSESPMQGREGMMFEYSAKDGEGVRSDGFYCQMDFNMEIALLIMAKLLGVWSEEASPEVYVLVCVGHTDHIYKLERGYMSHAMGMQRVERENNLRGYYFTKAIWEKYFPTVEV